MPGSKSSSIRAALIGISVSCLFMFIHSLEKHEPKKPSAAENKKQMDELMETIKSLQNKNIDTTLTIIYQGKAHTVTINKDRLEHLFAIKALAQKFRNQTKLDSFLVEKVDVTGDGTPEKVISHTFFEKGYLTTRTIYHGDKVIYHDTTFGDGTGVLGEDYTGDSTPFDFLEPYLSFYEEIQTQPLVDKEETSLTASINDPDANAVFCLVHHREGELQKKNLPKAEYDRQIEAFKDYFRNFRGHLITTTGPDPSELVWYEPERRFLQVFAS